MGADNTWEVTHPGPERLSFVPWFSFFQQFIINFELIFKLSIFNHKCYPPAELFKILKYDAVKVLHSLCQQIWKTQQWPQDVKRSVFIHLISPASKVILKILQARLQKHVKILRRGGKNTQNYTKNIFMTQIITMVWSLTCSQTSRHPEMHYYKQR